jgi:opacity protein-like surface antigen
MEPQFTAIPITLSAYYHFPLTTKMDAFLKAGVGYYMGKSKFNVRDELEIPGFPLRWQEEKRRASSNSLGFHGGIGLEFNLFKNIAFFLEGMGRYAKLKDWNVDVQYRNLAEESGTMSGTWYIVEVYNYSTEKYYKVIITSKGTPSSGEYYIFRNPKKAEISYSGISLRAGIKIAF